ncbi:lipopolysaccharide export system permease protein [Azospirillaceae bacterium]
MTRISRYLFRNLLVATILSTSALTLTIWITQSLRMIEFVINAGAPFLVFLYLMALSVPTFLGVVMPIALVGALLFTYNRFSADSELVVMRAVGLGSWRLSYPALTLAFMVMSAVLILNLYVSPYANRELVRMQYAVKHEYASVLIREGAFNNISDKLTVYLRSRNDKGEMQGLLVHDIRLPGKAVTIMAERGLMVDTEGGVRMAMINGLRQELTLATGRLSELYFESYVLEFQLFDDKSSDRWPDARERSLAELINPPNEVKRNPDMLRQFAAEMHTRFSTPLLVIAYTMISLASLLCGEHNRRGQGMRLIVAIGLVIVMQSLSIGLSGVANKTSLAIPALYLFNTLPILPAGWMLSRR